MKEKGRRRALAVALAALACCAVVGALLLYGRNVLSTVEQPEDWPDPPISADGEEYSSMTSVIEVYNAQRDLERSVVDGTAAERERQTFLQNFCDLYSAVQREALYSGDSGLVEELVALYGEDQVYEDSDRLGDVSTDQQLFDELCYAWGEEAVNEYLDAVADSMAAEIEVPSEYAEEDGVEYGKGTITVSFERSAGEEYARGLVAEFGGLWVDGTFAVPSGLSFARATVYFPNADELGYAGLEGICEEMSSREGVRGAEVFTTNDFTTSSDPNGGQGLCFG